MEVAQDDGHRSVGPGACSPPEESEAGSVSRADGQLNGRARSCDSVVPSDPVAIRRRLADREQRA